VGDKVCVYYRSSRTISTGLFFFSSGLVGDAAPPLSEKNIGNQMLKTMGWAPGQGLGPSCSGIREPVKAFKRPGRLGLGHSGK
jgi:hypothetical protein